MPQLQTCYVCDGLISTQAKTCPHCGQPQKSSGAFDGVLLTAWYSVTGLAAILVILAVFARGG